MLLTEPREIAIAMGHRNTDAVWYMAYGSNMSSAKFSGSRGIVPINSARVRIPGWTLVMEIPGIPYSEPSFGSIAPRQPSSTEKAQLPDVIGVAYLITLEQYKRVVASEGGGVAYTEICLVGEPVAQEDRDKTGDRVRLRTLGSSLMRRPIPFPSQRYMVRFQLKPKTSGADDTSV